MMINLYFMDIKNVNAYESSTRNDLFLEIF